VKKKSPKLWGAFTDEEFEKYLHAFVKNTLRRSSFRWPWRGLAVKKAWVERGVYKCAGCGGHAPSKEIRLDHIHPVVEPHIGFTTWDTFLRRLLVRETGFQVLCKDCHLTKTKEENERRKEIRAKRRGKV